MNHGIIHMCKIFGAVAVILVAAFLTVSGPVTRGVVAAPVFGVNLDFNSDHATAAPWVDVHKLFRRWGRVGRSWEEDPALRLTPQGYPLSEAEALTYLHGYPDGRYRLSYRGTGRVSFGGVGRIATRPVKTAGRTTAVVEVRGLGTNLLTLRIEDVSPDDPVHDLRLIAPGHSPESTDVYTPAFLRRLQPFTTLRFVDWMMANGSPVVHWSDRAGPDSFLRTGLAGVAYEDIVALANVAHKDLWITIPDQADDDYLRQLARLLRDTLDPERKVYVEYSNELWNTIYPQYQRNVAAAKSNRALASSDDYGRAGEQAAFKTAAVAAVFRKEFGAGSGRIRPVLCGQAVNPYFLERGLSFLKAKYGEPRHVLAGISVAPYVFLDASLDKPGLTLDALFAALDRDLNAQAADSIARNAALAKSHGLPLLAYEGGQHIVAWSPQLGANVNHELKLAAQNDPRMGRLIGELASTWARLGGGLFNHYTFIGPYSDAGYWGLLPEATRPGSAKWDALIRLARPGGDATLDGAVNYDDFQVLRRHWGETGRWWEQGDFDGDGKVGVGDLAILRRNLSGLKSSQAAEVAAFQPRSAGTSH